MNRPPAGPGQFAEVQGSPGIAPRLSGLLRFMWPLFGAAFLAGWLIRAALPMPALSRAGAGAGMLALAAAAAGYVAWSRRRIESFRKGARGEETVARDLAFLPAGFRVFHGLRLGGGVPGTEVEIDHAVVGPTGIFAIETKNWSGRITVADGKVLYDGREPDRPPLEQARQAAAGLRRRLEQADLAGLPVQAVLSFASETLDAPSRGIEGVVLCRHGALPQVLRDSVDVPLSPAQCARIAACLQSLVE